MKNADVPESGVSFNGWEKISEDDVLIEENKEHNVTTVKPLLEETAKRREKDISTKMSTNPR